MQIKTHEEPVSPCPAGPGVQRGGFGLNSTDEMPLQIHEPRHAVRNPAGQLTDCGMFLNIQSDVTSFDFADL